MSPVERSATEASRLRGALQAIAPGTTLREGLERILRGRTGALLVIGHSHQVDAISTGGFDIDVAFTATRLRELAKMDGAIILDAGADRIVRAGVHLMPDPTIATDESGTRHRTADRVARQTGLPVVSVSASMHLIALYLDSHRHVLEDTGAVLNRANQALSTLERYRARLDEVADSLSALEVEDLVTVRDVVTVVQRLEMVTRIAAEIENYVVELGTDGRLLALQLEELVSGVESEREFLIRDYLPDSGAADVESIVERLAALDSTELVAVENIAEALNIGRGEDLDEPLSPRGYRLLSRVPRLSTTLAHRLVVHYGALQKLLAATIDDLQNVEGVTERRARSLREGLSRLAESSILERYV